jgi:hypothetical protein
MCIISPNEIVIFGPIIFELLFVELIPYCVSLIILRDRFLRSIVGSRQSVTGVLVWAVLGVGNVGLNPC